MKTSAAVGCLASDEFICTAERLPSRGKSCVSLKNMWDDTKPSGSKWHVARSSCSVAILPSVGFRSSRRRRKCLYYEDGAHASVSCSDFAAKYIWDVIYQDLSRSKL